MSNMLVSDSQGSTGAILRIHRPHLVLVVLLVCALAFVGVSLWGVETVSASNTNFQLTVDVEDPEGYDVGYRAAASVLDPKHGWRLAIVANYVNTNNPNDLLGLWVSVATDGSYLDSPPWVVVTSDPVPLEDPDYTGCSPNNPFDRYQIGGYAQDLITISLRQYELVDFSYDVRTSDASNQAYHAKFQGECYTRDYSSCTNCNVVGTTDYVTATIHTVAQ